MENETITSSELDVASVFEMLADDDVAAELVRRVVSDNEALTDLELLSRPDVPEKLDGPLTVAEPADRTGEQLQRREARRRKRRERREALRQASEPGLPGFPRRR